MIKICDFGTVADLRTLMTENQVCVCTRVRDVTVMSICHFDIIVMSLRLTCDVTVMSLVLSPCHCMDNAIYHIHVNNVAISAESDV